MAPRIVKQNSHVTRCFGRGRKSCVCPPRLKPYCAAVKFTELRSPLVLRAAPGERPKGYAMIDKRIASRWGYDPEPCDGVKLTYFHLAFRAEKVSRWVFARPERMAEDRGIPLRTYVEHLKELERLSLIVRVPMCDVVTGRGGRFKTVFLLDFPPSFGGVDEGAVESAATGPVAEEERVCKRWFSAEHASDANAEAHDDD